MPPVLAPRVDLADLGVLLDPVDALDDHPVGLAEHRDDLALGALVLAGDDLDGVALLDAYAMLRAPPAPAR